MIQTSTHTHDDILRYVYDETSGYENTQIEDSLMSDSELLKFYLGTLEIKNELNKIVRTPSDRVIQNILQFSVNYAMA